MIFMLIVFIGTIVGIVTLPSKCAKAADDFANEPTAEEIRDSLREDSIYKATMKGANINIDDEGSGTETRQKSKEDEDEEGNGILYIGDYRYPNAETVTIHGKPYDVAIGEYDTDVDRKLPQPDNISTSNVAGNKMKTYAWDNNAVMIIFANGQIYDIMQNK